MNYKITQKKVSKSGELQALEEKEVTSPKEVVQPSTNPTKNTEEFKVVYHYKPRSTDQSGS